MIWLILLGGLFWFCCRRVLFGRTFCVLSLVCLTGQLAFCQSSGVESFTEYAVFVEPSSGGQASLVVPPGSVPGSSPSSTAMEILCNTSAGGSVTVGGGVSGGYVWEPLLTFYSIGGGDYEATFQAARGFTSTGGTFSTVDLWSVYAGADYSWGYEFVGPVHTFFVGTLGGAPPLPGALAFGPGWENFDCWVEPDGVTDPLGLIAYSGLPSVGLVGSVTGPYPSGNGSTTQPAFFASTQPTTVPSASGLLRMIHDTATTMPAAYSSTDNDVFRAAFWGLPGMLEDCVATPSTSSVLTAIAGEGAYWEGSEFKGGLSTSDDHWAYFYKLFHADPGTPLSTQVFGELVQMMESHYPYGSSGYPIRVLLAGPLLLLRIVSELLLGIGLVSVNYRWWMRTFNAVDAQSSLADRSVAVSDLPDFM